MKRKFSLSETDECNNNGIETIQEPKRRRMDIEHRLKKQLQSDFTDKMILPLTSPEGQPTSRSGRKINFIETTSHKSRKSMTTTTTTSKTSKRKVRTPNSLYTNNGNANLRLVSKRQSTILAKSPIDKLINQTKHQLKTDQFQSQLTEKSTCSDTSIIEVRSEFRIMNSDCITQTDKYMDTNTGTEPMQYDDDGLVDFEERLKKYHVSKRPKSETKIEITNEPVEQIDLTNSDSEIEDDEPMDEQKPESFSTLEADSTSSPDASIQNENQFQRDITNSNEIINISSPVSESVTSTSKSDAIVLNDKPYSDCDDCIIADEYASDSTESWHVGQIVWAALAGFNFWPAVIFNDTDENTFQKDNQIHVKFLHDNGRHNWVKQPTSILPFKGYDNFIELSKLPRNKKNKAYKQCTSKKNWQLALREANALLNIKLSNRIDFYDRILMDAVHEIDHDMRSNRLKLNDRCDTPQTFDTGDTGDTAYSSMKQSVSPVSSSPTLTDLDRNCDLDKNINISHYFKSIECTKIPEDDVQMFSETVAYAASADSSSTSDQMAHCALVKLVFDKMKESEPPIDHSILIDENRFTASLTELWSEMTQIKQKQSLHKSRRMSLDSTATNSTATTPNQTKRQIELANRKALAEKQTMIAKALSNENQPNKSKPSTEQSKIDKQRKINETISKFCMENYPANFLLKGLPKDPVCSCCLESGNVMKCAGVCNGYFHKDCLSRIVDINAYHVALKKKIKDQDDEKEPTSTVEENVDKLHCLSCTNAKTNGCFVCCKSDDDCIRCDKNCGKSYHIKCLKYWPQNKIVYAGKQIKSLHCPRHVCHTCVSPDVKNMFHTIESDRKLIKCMLCPGTYHRSHCIPAGSELLSESQLICARHMPTGNLKQTNIDYCLICSKGGSLICCDSCANAFHQDCLNVPVDDNFNCEECESGRRPLYGEMVWCKYRNCQWWPGITVPTPCIPDSLLAHKTQPYLICIYFFGAHNYGWVPQAHIYRYEKGDGEFKSAKDKEQLKAAMDEAETWVDRFKDVDEMNIKFGSLSSKPPPYRKIKTNRILAKFQESEYTECTCRPDDLAACSVENGCYNVVAHFECHPDLCPAKDKCQNQNFLRGEQFAFQVKMTESKGWGLFAKEDIPPEKFVIEYMGEVIDSAEFDERFNRAKDEKQNNFYFLTLGRNLYIDAFNYGNEARFINHSCEPNVEPNKWTVYSNGQEQIRIGLFSLRKILAGEEITFNYNWGTKDMITVCHCGSSSCQGHM